MKRYEGCKRKKTTHSKYKHSCTIHSFTKVSDRMGGYVKTPVVFATVFVEFWKQTAKQAVENLREDSPETIIINLQYIAGVDETQTITSNENGRVFEIKTSINVKEENRELLLMCRELVDGS
ncbi:MAG: phage head closure protein [Bacteroidetes bacterium]|nr:phage head closure protein [Bacteroidota bacterium]